MSFIRKLKLLTIETFFGLELSLAVYSFLKLSDGLYDNQLGWAEPF